MAVMYVWTADKDSWGHASLSFENDNSSGRSGRGGSGGWNLPFFWTNNEFEWGHSVGIRTLSWLLKLLYPPPDSFYISWWPTEDKSKNSMKKKKTEGRTKECVPVDYEDERYHFTGREFTHRFYIRIGAKGVDKIRKWWENIKDKGGYNFLFNNCCDAVVQALRVGGIEIDPSLIIIRKPGDMVGLGERLEKKTAELNEDVKCWKKIRHETLPRLNVLKQELYRANENLKEVRTMRIITTGTSLFFGALLAPLTQGASMVVADAMTTGTLKLIIETIIERNVIEKTQACVNEDEKETIRLRQRKAAFQGTESSPFAVELFTVNLDTIFGLSEQSLLSFITSWARTDTSTPLLNAIVKLEMYIRNLESELNTVKKVQEKYAMP